MAGQILRLSREKFYNKPHLITETSLREIADYVDARNLGDFEAAISARELAQTMGVPEAQLLSNGIGLIPVLGALTYESTGFEAICGGASYQGILEDFDKLAQQGATTIVLDLDTPGGEAYGLFETGRSLRKRADEQGIKLVAYVDGLAASAGYGLASAAHEIISNPQAESGSIGVVVRLVNTNKAMEEAGVQTTYIYAGDNKIPFDAEGEFTEAFLTDIQEKVDTVYQEFTSYVAELRGMSQDDVIATQAGTFMAAQALELGLVDSLLTREEFFEKLAQDRQESMPLNNRVNKNGEGREMSTEDLNTPIVAEADTAVLTELDKLKTELAAEKDKRAQLEQSARQEKITALAAKAEGWGLADVNAYAEAAVDGSVPVELFDAAMDKADKQLKDSEAGFKALQAEFEALGEVGVADAEEQAETQVDGVEAALKVQGKISK